MSVDQWRESEVEQAATWRRAVEAAVDYLADDYDVDPDELLAQEAFIARLDGTLDLDPDTDAELLGALVEAAVAEHTGESYQPEHAPAGSPTGGQFTAGGGGGTAKKPPAKRAAGKPMPKKPAGPMGFDGKSGTGYDTPGGDPQVKELQRVLTQLGFRDAQGKPLAPDGKFGPKTMAAVQAMQQKYGGMATDGKVTPELLARLKAAAAPKKGTPAKPPGRAKEAVDVEDERTTEATDHIEGHATESLGVDAAGGRVFRVRIIREGVSRNKKRYKGHVLEAARPLYEGAKAFDHHRTAQEMQTSTVAGLVGGYRDVTYEPGDGLYGNLHLLPSAVHPAEALDASIAAQTAGLPPLVGISHDVLASFKAGQPTSGGHVQEAVAITRVHSADVVADPSAGGQATRVLAGGIESDTEESDVTVTTEAVLAALQSAGDAELAAAGLARVDTHTTEAVGEPKGSFIAGLLVSHKLQAAGLPEAVKESVLAALPERVTEADVDRQIASYKNVLAGLERGGLAPTVTTQVVKESRDKVVDGLNRAFDGDYSYFRSFKQAYEAFSGSNPRRWDEDENRTILRESVGSLYDSATRTTESLTASSWAEVLGDSITRKTIQMYKSPDLRNWRPIVSDIVPINDFRTQRRVRTGGYGTLPVVNEGAPYQPLTSPGDEEATYAIEKKGGTEDLTMEMIANDDLSAITRIPRLLGLAAARTLHNFVWDFLATNPTIYDSVALFHASHANTTAVALSQSGASSLRQKMRDQTGYGDSSNILSLVQRYLIVPNELEELAFQICASAVAVPSTPAGPSDTPNIHRTLEPIVVDYFTDANDWYTVASPELCPTIELGFYQGREEPELYTQADQSVGSMFNADKYTYKIRHIYKGAVVEYRGFQRGTQ
jgi:hypothetical protein